MSPLTTHVLDIARGRPAVGVPLTLIAPDGTVTTGQLTVRGTTGPEVRRKL